MAEVRDIAPGLLEAIMEDFNRLIAEDSEVEYIVENGRAYVDAHHYADRVGEHLAEAFRNNISSGVLPDGKMYYNIAERTVRPAIENGRLLINGMSGMVQESLNEAAGIGLRAITPAPDTQRVDGIINRLASEDNFDDVAWLLDEPVKTLSRSFVDDYIKANANFHARSGLSPRITRTSTGDCCEWCSRIAGTYEYGSASMPQDIFRRHNRCRCMVLYDPADGRGYQDAHSKQWYDSEEEARIEQRKNVGLIESGAKKLPGWEDRHAKLYYKEIRNRAPFADARRIAQNISEFDENQIEDIRQHMFIREQPRDGGLKPFVPDYDQAEAWQRLIEGRNIRPSDIVLLQHEYYELTIMRETGCTYEYAHDLTDKVYNWWAEVIKEG